MNNKILTISVAAYNVQKYIGQCLDSLIGIEDIEVIVVDDGSTDNTLNIVNEYQNKYPNVFKIVHKENGGYGSTVNYSIANATGRFFKLLDGDDWYDNNGLKQLVEFLKYTNVDCVFTKFKKYFFKNDILTKVVDGINFKEYDRKNEIDIHSLIFNEGIPMHCITYKTDLINDLRLKENMLYTDNYYATLPFKKIKTVIFKDINVYNYRLGIANQSVSKEKLIKNANDSRAISIDLAKEYNGENKYLLNRIASTCVDYFVILIKMSNSKEQIVEFDKMIKNISKDVYNKMVTLNRNASRLLSFYRLLNYKFIL